MLKTILGLVFLISAALATAQIAPRAPSPPAGAVFDRPSYTGRDTVQTQMPANAPINPGIPAYYSPTCESEARSLRGKIESLERLVELQSEKIKLLEEKTKTAKK